ncbi:MAG: adenine deaminase [Sphaerochaetaceae bacterium]|nr:adenine deaminase [Sphaerochaetaceae bacterium]
MDYYKYNDKKNLIDCAMGRKPADLRITNCKIVDVFNKDIFTSDLLISNGKIAGFADQNTPEALKTLDAKGKYIVPGFIDSHVHIESSHVSPEEFSRLVVPCGTTTIIADPHEICNVCGLDGLDYMLKASQDIPLNVFFMIPSCVPATSFENSGAILKAEDIQKRMDNPRILGLGEMMNYVGVVLNDEQVLKKILLSEEYGKITDGHSPGIEGTTLDAYTSAGIHTDHECDTPKELVERLRRGMYVMLRQGSACKNVLNLLKGVTNLNSQRCVFCTDDRQPASILFEGHINNNVKIAIADGLDPIIAISMATINAAECYNLNDRGAIAPGRRADFMIVNNLKDLNIEKVFTLGKCVAENNKYLVPVEKIKPEKVSGRMQVAPLTVDSFAINLKSKRVRCISIIPGSVVTNEEEATVKLDQKGNYQNQENQDIVKIGVIERHHKTGNKAFSLLTGYGLKNGAVATTIAHDSHNIMVAGDNDKDMYLAVQELIKIGGGISIAQNNKILSSLAHPIAGIMTDISGKEFEEKLRVMHGIAQDKLQINPNIDPFMTLSFMALPVIPKLKITDLGLFDVTKFEFTTNEI